MTRFSAKSENLFCLTQSVTQSLITMLRMVVQVRGVAVGRTRLMCTRLQHRTCKTSRGYVNSNGLGAHGFSTERARLAGGTSRLLNMGILNKKKGLLNMGILNKKRPAEYGDFEPKFPKSQT